MMQHLRGFGLAATLVLISSLAVVPKAKSQSTSAYVYVQVGGPAGAVYGYSASSGGQLTAIPGSPFNPGTEIVGATASRFFTIGKTLLHSYALGSNGAIGAQESQIAFLDYSGGTCGGGTSGYAQAVLDHSGQYVYVLLQNGGGSTCSAYQTYMVNSDGSFTFMGDSEVTYPSGDGTDSPSILGNETFGYADQFSGNNNGIIGFQRQSTGTLEYSGPLNPTFSGSATYTPSYPDASPTGNYVVLQLLPNDSNPPQLGSFTVGSNGTLSSTNTSSNMPTSQLLGPGSVFSPDGTMLALYANAQNGAGHLGNGIEIYSFNGAAPLTKDTSMLNGTPIDQAAWDTSNHLYAFSTSENKLWAIDVTPSASSAWAPISINAPFHMVVLSQTASTSGGGGTGTGGGGTGTGGGSCAVPSSPGVTVCSPDENASVTSPVQIDAAANVTGGVYRFELWNGSTKLASVDGDTMDQPVTLAPGTYHLTFVARNTSGTHEYAYRDVTVTGSTSGGGTGGGSTGGSGSGGSCTAPSSQGVNVCTPDENATVTSPVQMEAAANVTGGVYRFELWNGGTKLASVDNSNMMNLPVALTPGTYHLTFVARSSSGDHQYAYRDITVTSGGGTATTQYSAPLLTTTGTLATDGQITIDTNGNAAVQVAEQAASHTFTVRFCPAFDANTTTPPSCFNVMTFSTDGSGNGSATVKFPLAGNWAGDFSVIDSAGNGSPTLQTGLIPGASNESFMAKLLPESTTNSGAPAAQKGQDPLSSGTVSYSNGNAAFTVNGASPNTSYGPVETQGTAIDSSSSYALPSFTTDGSGNGSTSFNLKSQGTSGGDMFTVEAGSAAGYIGGFMIP
ncbi:MAG: hypothetical protein ACLGSD_07740 [Acidobacteriota bacterium]